MLEIPKFYPNHMSKQELSNFFSDNMESTCIHMYSYIKICLRKFENLKLIYIEKSEVNDIHKLFVCLNI